MHLFPTAPSRVIDIGAGTGRDAAGFAELGHAVTAVEPTPELRAEAQRLHPQSRDHLDRRFAARSRPACTRWVQRYDVVMLTAVWMHLDPAQRERAMARVAPLVRPGGLMACRCATVRCRPAAHVRCLGRRDARARRASRPETIHESEGPALLGGPAVWWDRLAFRAQR